MSTTVPASMPPGPWLPPMFPHESFYTSCVTYPRYTCTVLPVLSSFYPLPSIEPYAPVPSSTFQTMSSISSVPQETVIRGTSSISQHPLPSVESYVPVVSSTFQTMSSITSVPQETVMGISSIPHPPPTIIVTMSKSSGNITRCKVEPFRLFPVWLLIIFKEMDLCILPPHLLRARRTQPLAVCLRFWDGCNKLRHRPVVDCLLMISSLFFK